MHQPDLAITFGSAPHKIIWTAFNFFQVPESRMAEFTSSPLVFTMALEIIIRASLWVVGGRLENGLRLPTIRAYMDDMRIITTTKPCTECLLDKLQDNINWAQLRIKPVASPSLKGQLANETFCISGEPILTILEKPIKSLVGGITQP